MTKNIVNQLRQAGYTEEQLYEAGFGESVEKETNKCPDQFEGDPSDCGMSCPYGHVCMY